VVSRPSVDTLAGTRGLWGSEGSRRLDDDGGAEWLVGISDMGRFCHGVAQGLDRLRCEVGGRRRRSA